MATKEEYKALILDSVSDLVSDFLYYDRKEDEELPVDKIEELIKDGVITVDEIIDKFTKELKKNF